MKKVTFQGKRPSVAEIKVDDWVENREVEPPKEVTKRLTIDVPVSLHKRIKSTCALQDLGMADVIREILEQEFPVSVGPGGPS